MSSIQVGDKFLHSNGVVLTYTHFDNRSNWFEDSDGDKWVFTPSDTKLKLKPVPSTPAGASKESLPHGGPSSYYDLPFSSWVTVNDQMEYLAEHKWGKYSIHLKDIFKGLCRWNDKEGTTIEYDTNKIIYYGVRVLRMLKGNKGVQEYLTKLLNDPQFKG